MEGESEKGEVHKERERENKQCKKKRVQNRNRDGIAAGEHRELCGASLECSSRLLQIRLKQEIAIWRHSVSSGILRDSLSFHKAQCRAVCH